MKWWNGANGRLWLLSGWVLVAIALGLAVFGCAARPGSRLRVVTTTTLISSIVEAIGGKYVQATAIAPGGMCPGHFDIPPSAVAAANDAQLLLNHGWEEWFAKLEQALHNPRVIRRTLSTKGNWMVPAIHKQAVKEVLQLLVEIDSAHADSFRLAAQYYTAQIDSAAAQACSLFSGRAMPRVIAAEHQAPFLRWLGFSVVATYGRPEEFTAQELVRLARVMADSGVMLVVDNLQSGSDAGKPLAEAHGVAHVTLTNFPLPGKAKNQKSKKAGKPESQKAEKPAYCQALLDNARALASALEGLNP
ncbi:MAG: zinc ABC transporter substrate-binding protein [candidate division WOR-3 bacterium]